jgi:hypothetical protein
MPRSPLLTLTSRLTEGKTSGPDSPVTPAAPVAGERPRVSLLQAPGPVGEGVSGRATLSLSQGIARRLATRPRTDPPHESRQRRSIARDAGLLSNVWRWENLRADGWRRRSVCRPRRPVSTLYAGVANVGLLSSASRSVLRAARWVTAAPAIRWVAARSGMGPDVVGIVTVTCRCSAR